MFRDLSIFIFCPVWFYLIVFQFNFFLKQDFQPNCTSTLHGFVGFVTKNPKKAENERIEKFKKQILTTDQKIHVDLSNVGFL